ncbi:hypothetical protein EK904_002427 [Melospiza melodia maxima]|nr:hypothetical protein EK904_002427 [Melospiza melodia maxima]
MKLCFHQRRNRSVSQHVKGNDQLSVERQGCSGSCVSLRELSRGAAPSVQAQGHCRALPEQRPLHTHQLLLGNKRAASVWCAVPKTSDVPPEKAS